MDSTVKKKGLSTGQIVALVLSLTLGSIFIIIAIYVRVSTQKVSGIMKDATDEALKRTAELAYSGVEYAITSYMYDNYGEVPEYVDDIESYFRANNVTLEVTGVGENSKGKIISSDKKLCDVTAYNGNFTVDCSEVGVDEKVIKLHP